MENGPFIDGLPNLKMVDLSMAMLNNQMVVNLRPKVSGVLGATLLIVWMGKDSYPCGKKWRLMRHPVSKRKSEGWLLNCFEGSSSDL